MGKRRNCPDPIRDYIEWTEHRYNPGHYLGGNLPPYLRKSSLGPRARRRMSWSLLGSAIGGAAVGLIWIWTEGAGAPRDPLRLLLLVITTTITVATLVLYVLAALSMQHRPKKRGPRRSRQCR